MDQRFPRSGKFMALTATIGYDKFLFCSIDEKDKIRIDDQAPSDSEEVHPSFSELVRDHILQLSDLVCDKIREPVFEVDHGIVRLRADEHQAIGREADEFRFR